MVGLDEVGYSLVVLPACLSAVAVLEHAVAEYLSSE